MPNIKKIYKLLDPEILAKNIHALKLYLRGKQWDLLQPETKDPVFLVGCSRSGTTVAYESFANSSQLLSIGYEIPQFWNSLWGPKHNNWESEAATTDNACPEHRTAAMRHFYQCIGLGRILDKTCINVMRIPYLYSLFPNARFIYIQRDGRDNISSMMDGWRHSGHFRLSQFLGEFPEDVSINNGEFHEWSFFLPPGWRKYNHSSLEEVCAFQWISANRLALTAKKTIPEHQWVHLRYEDIFTRPVEMFEQAFAQLELPFEDTVREHCATINSRPTSIVNGMPKQQKWKSHNPDAILRILKTITPMMLELGYEPDE